MYTIYIYDTEIVIFLLLNKHDSLHVLFLYSPD